jgi:serine/threonine protein kinase
MSENKRIGKYEIAEQIGVGGFGVVYRAWDPFIQRWVALKTCNTSDKEATQRFFREAQLAGALAHPNITLIFDFGVEEETPYFVQEFLSGTDLDELLESKHPTLEGVLAILLQVCSGLDFAHSRGIIHRDIKPANIRVLEDGTVKIMDFGIAKSLDSESRLTQTGVALGTAGYLAPEQLSGKPLDPRTDLFSLGVMAYEMVTGSRPFAGPNLSNVIYQILNQEPVPLRQRNLACPERLEKAILKALAKKPEARYANVREFATDIKTILSSITQKSVARKSETTTAVVREELARLVSQPRGAGVTGQTQLAARPLDVVATEAVPRPGQHPRKLIWLLALSPLVVVPTAYLLFRGADSGSSATNATPAPTALATPTAPPLAPTPFPPTATMPAEVAVELFVDPPSEIIIDGTSLGQMAFSTQLRLSIGPHTIVQRIPGYRESTKRIEVRPDSPPFRFELPPFGILTVMNDPEVAPRGAVVFLDGSELGPLPVQDFKVEAGAHELLVTWPNGTRFAEQIEVPAKARVVRAAKPQ